MTDLPQGWAPDALVHRALQVRNCKAPPLTQTKGYATKAQVIELVSFSLSGADVDASKERVSRLIDRLTLADCLSWTPSGRHEPVISAAAHAASLIGTARLGSQSSSPSKREIDRIFAERRGDVPNPSSKPSAHEEGPEIFVLSLDEVEHCRQSFIDIGQWSPLCDELFGKIRQQPAPTVANGTTVIQQNRVWSTRKDVIAAVKPHWNVINTALQKGPSDSPGPYGWIKQFKRPSGAHGWDREGIIEYLKSHEMWSERREGVTLVFMGKAGKA